MNRLISDHAKGIAGALFVIALYAVGERFDGPSESEAAQAVADISQERAAEFAAINRRALVAKE
ncbi:hypothetical protein [Variovorax sp. GB1P17]|uniref:hypothetical protein n=1 Tax=Variovorax sp. GB1P17 TaxID=3443740 RepID=UPI003F487183